MSKLNKLNKLSNLIHSELVITTIYFLVAFIGIKNHELWFDELQAWQIASTADNLFDFYNNFNIEGHPPLWHLCLYVISRFTRDPWFMQLFHITISTFSVFLFAKYSPFNLLQKLAWSFGYYSLFEYGIISRSYSLGVLLVFIFCVTYLKNPKDYIRLALVLGLMLNTSIYGLIIAFGLFVILTIDFFANHKKHTSYKGIIIGFFILFVCSICSLLFIFKIDSSLIGQNFNEAHGWPIIAERLSNFTNAFFRVPDFRKTAFWGTNYFNNVDSNMEFCLFSLFLILFFAIVITKLNRSIGVFYIITNLFLILFMTYVMYGFVRHVGHLWIVLVVSIWLVKKKTQNISMLNVLMKRLEYVFNFFLLIQLLSGLVCYGFDIDRKFSSYPEVGKFLNSLKEPKVVLGSNYLGPVSAYMPGKKIFMLDHNKFENKLSLSSLSDPMVTDSLIDVVVQKYSSANNIYLVIEASDVNTYGLRLNKFKIVKEFDGTSNIGFLNRIRVYKYSKGEQ